MTPTFKGALAALAFVLAGSSAQATPLPLLGDLVPGLGNAATVADSGAEAASLIDSDGAGDDSGVERFLQFQSMGSDNGFGIYGFDIEANGDITLGNLLEVFGAGAASFTELVFNTDTGEVTNRATMETTLIGTTFGFYLETPDGSGDFLYSHASLNAAEADHALIYDTSEIFDPLLSGSNVVVAFSDIPFPQPQAANGAEPAFSVTGLTDVAVVSEPASLALVGLALMGLAVARRAPRD